MRKQQRQEDVSLQNEWTIGSSRHSSRRKKERVIDRNKMAKKDKPSR